MSDLKAILKHAKKEGYIQSIPEIEKCSNEPKKTKGVLTSDEIKALFSDVNNFPNFISYCANLLASHTGLRLSEVQAIQLKNINPAGFIEIEKSWNNKLRRLNDTTKSGKVRRVVIPAKVKDQLQKLIELNPYGEPDSFLFFSQSTDIDYKIIQITKEPDFVPTKEYIKSKFNCTDQHANRYLSKIKNQKIKPNNSTPANANYPVDCNLITKGLYKALEKIGITPDERKERAISFHSFRYFLNSLLIAGKIPLIQVQAMTGHLTQQMTEHYYLSQNDQMDDVRKLQEGIL